MGAYIVVDAAPALEPLLNDVPRKLAKKRELKRWIHSAVRIAGGRMSPHTRRSRFVAEFESSRLAEEAIAILQLQSTSAVLSIGTNLASLAGRRTAKAFAAKPVTDDLSSSIWSSSVRFPKAVESDQALRDYASAADLLSTLVMAASLPRMESRAFARLTPHLKAVSSAIPKKQTQRLAYVGVAMPSPPGDWRIVMSWKELPVQPPDSMEIRGRIYKVEHEQAREFALEADTRRRPPFLGSSISRNVPNSLKGRICCLVRLEGSKSEEDDVVRMGKEFFLSVSHVMGNGTSPWSGSRIWQPSIRDGGAAGDEIGTVVYASPLLPSPLTSIDAAYAELDGVPIARTVGFMGPVLRVARAPSPGMNVWKVDVGNGVPNKAVVNRFYPTLPVPHPVNPWNVVFRNVWGCQPGYSVPGDSGCGIVEDKSNALVGLHLAGNGAISCFQDIDSVFSALKIELA